MAEKLYDVAVLGGGPGGCTAALYAARAGLRTVVLEQLSAGGQMADTPLIENYPGFPEGVGGFELGQLMQQGAERAGAEFRLSQVLSASLAGPVKRIETDGGPLRRSGHRRHPPAAGP